MSVRFSETLQRSREVLQAQPWCARLDSITIVRDVRGQIHLFLEGYRPNDQERSVLQEALAAPDALVPYWTGDVWLPSPDPRAPASALSDMISKQRSALPGWTSPPRWHILERHIAKQSWTERPSSPEPPWPVANVYSGVAPVIVAFFSFKGGLGRTTTAVATSLVLAQFGHRVALIDLDLEAPGLASMFLGESDDRAGVIDYLIEKPVQRDDWHLRECVHSVTEPHLIGDEGAPLRLLPAGNIDADYLEKLSRVDVQNLEGGRLTEILRQLLQELRGEVAGGLDFVLLDARAGLHELGGLALCELAHAAVVLGIHSSQSWAGLGWTWYYSVWRGPTRTKACRW